MPATPPLAVTAIGMVSSLGSDAANSCAASRAGITGGAALEGSQVWEQDLAESEPVRGHPVPWVADGFTGLGRLASLGEAGLRDLVRNARLEDWSACALFVAISDEPYRGVAEARGWLPPEHDSRLDLYSERLTSAILTALRVSARPRLQDVFSGSSGFIQAVHEAALLLQSRKVERCIVGGVDSLVEPDCVEVLERLRVLKTPSQAVGFQPGEAAGFLQLELPAVAVRRGVSIQAMLAAPSWEAEPFNRFSGTPACGGALSRSILRTFEQSDKDGGVVGLIIGALDGDAYRSQDWGHALVRLKATRRMDVPREWYPALSFGEIGVATGPVGVCMAVRAFARGYARTDRVLVWTGGDDGHRGSLDVRSSRAD